MGKHYEYIWVFSKSFTSSRYTGTTLNTPTSWVPTPWMTAEVEEKFLHTSQALTTPGQKLVDWLDILIGFLFSLYFICIHDFELCKALIRMRGGAYL